MGGMNGEELWKCSSTPGKTALGVCQGPESASRLGVCGGHSQGLSSG